jgi:predicted transposase YbfD/YdcC
MEGLLMSSRKYKGEFFESFEVLEDKRQEGKVWHKLIDILFIAISAVISGCNEWSEIHTWAGYNENWLRKYLELPNGIPSKSTIWRMFNAIIPEQFEKCFAAWMKKVVDLDEKEIVPIDGKTMRGSQQTCKGKKGVHIVSALCRSYNLVLGQVKTEEKSNEITAIPELLDILYIKGCIVSIDAMLSKSLDNMAYTKLYVMQSWMLKAA